MRNEITKLRVLLYYEMYITIKSTNSQCTKCMHSVFYNKLLKVTDATSMEFVDYDGGQSHAQFVRLVLG